MILSISLRQVQLRQSITIYIPTTDSTNMHCMSRLSRQKNRAKYSENWYQFILLPRFVNCELFPKIKELKLGRVCDWLQERGLQMSRGLFNKIKFPWESLKEILLLCSLKETTEKKKSNQNHLSFCRSQWEHILSLLLQ